MKKEILAKLTTQAFEYASTKSQEEFMQNFSAKLADLALLDIAKALDAGDPGFNDHSKRVLSARYGVRV